VPHDLHTTATELLARLQSGELTSRELTESCLKRIAAYDLEIGAFLSVDPEATLARADRIDRRRAAGESLGLLGGLPVAVKDILCTAGQTTTCGSRMLQKFIPPYDATVITKLLAADAVLVGKTNLDEFAMGGTTENSAYHQTRNPWQLDRTPPLASQPPWRLYRSAQTQVGPSANRQPSVESWVLSQPTGE